MLLLLIAFRSVVAPLQAAFVNLLAVGAAYGVLTAVFQDGHGAQAIGLDGAIPIVSYVPMMMFAILFGLAMDYQVFLLSRVREEIDAGKSSRQAVIDGLAGTGKVIASAAAIMVAVFASFILNGDPTVKEFGVGLASAILIAGRRVCLLLPAVMLLMGDRTWWPPQGLPRQAPNSWRNARLPMKAHMHSRLVTLITLVAALGAALALPGVAAACSKDDKA